MTQGIDHADLNKPAADPAIWSLDPKVVFLNHGSFGACPRPVLEFQSELRARLERQPLQFLARDLEPLLDSAREALARFVGADAEDLVFVPNATAGVNTVLRSLEFGRGDELLVADQEYNACRNALNFVAERSGAQVVVAKLPFPVSGPDDLVGPILERVTARTRLLLIDHVTSQTGLVMPLGRIVSELASRGIDTLIDGAHAPGMVPLDLNTLEAAYYSANCHKWLCAPKGAGLLHVRRDKQKLIRPLTISHGANSQRADRSRYLIEFAWQGTWDPTAYLSIPAALRFVGSLVGGGWPEVMARNRALALASRRVLCSALKIDEPCPEEMIGSLASVPLTNAPQAGTMRAPLYEYPLQDVLRLKHAIEVPIMPWPAPPARLLRISTQLYNALPQCEFLSRKLAEELAAERRV